MMYHLIENKTGKIALKAEDGSFLEGMRAMMLYPDTYRVEIVAENGLESVSDDVPELSVTEPLPDEYWHSMNKD